MNKIAFLLLMLVSLLQANIIAAKDLGAVGTVYPIIETDFLKAIQQRLQEKIQHGEWKRWAQNQIQAIRIAADRPLPVVGLTPAQETRSWLMDPSWSIKQDGLDTDGPIALPTDLRFNPLAQVIWTKTLLFYNGDDPQQVAWVKQRNQQLQGQVLLILTQGSIAEQTQQLKQRIYFDQGGQLVQRFGITQMPASVEQEGKQLRVTEVNL